MRRRGGLRWAGRAAVYKGLAVRHGWRDRAGRRGQVLVVSTTPPTRRAAVPARRGRGGVCVTSKRGSEAEGRAVGVEVLTPVRRWSSWPCGPVVCDQAGPGKLADELGFMPRILAQAAAVIRGTAAGVAHLPGRLRARRLDAVPETAGTGSLPHGVGLRPVLCCRWRRSRPANRGDVCKGKEFIAGGRRTACAGT